MNPATEEILWSKTVPTETVRRAVQILAPHALFIKYDVDVVKGGDATAAAVTKPALSVWASVPVDQASSLAEDLARLPEVAVHLNASPGGDFSLMGIQITHFQADKEHAVGELARLLGIDKAHTMAVGDGDNDLPLFRSAKIKVAVGNASEKLKAAADHVVADVQHDGFAAAVNTFVSGKSR